MIVKKQLPPPSMPEDLRDEWKVWCRRYGIDPSEVVGDQTITIDTEAKTITYVGYDLCEKGHRHIDWDGRAARQSTRIVKLETTPAPFPRDDVSVDDTCKSWERDYTPRGACPEHVDPEPQLTWM